MSRTPILLLLGLLACSGSDDSNDPDDTGDAPPVDTGDDDSGDPDSGDDDSGDPDSGEDDSGDPDTGEDDSGDPDSGDDDSGDPDSGDDDSGDPDSGDDDSGVDTADTGGDDPPALPCEGRSIGAMEGYCAPDFTLPDHTGTLVSLYDLAGRVILLDFSAPS